MTTERDDGHGPYVPLSGRRVTAAARAERSLGWDIFHTAMARELLHLRERQEVHLKLIADMSKQEVSPEHAERLNARVASLVAEVGTLRSHLNELEVANSRLEGDSLDLHEKIDEWKAASGLSDSSGDPDSIEPRHLARRIREDDSRHRLLLRELDAERKVHASTALALDTAGAKVAVIERLETWLKGDSNRLIEASYGSAHWAYASLSNDGCYLAGDSNNETDTVAAIDAALREVEST